MDLSVHLPLLPLRVKGGRRLPGRATPVGTNGAADDVDATNTKPTESTERRGLSTRKRAWLIAGAVVAVVALVAASVVIVRMLNQDPPLPWNSRMCAVMDDTTLAIRARVGRPEGYASCAVVGSAGFMRKQRLGKEIDAHEMVMRTNLSPLGGFEKIVGTKTTMRVVNSVASNLIQQHVLCNASYAYNCPNYTLFGNCDPIIQNTYTARCGVGTVIRRDEITVNDPVVNALHPPWWSNVMSGSWAVAMAMRLCPNGMDVYGMSHNNTQEFGRNAPYHYYDHHQVDSGTDNLPYTAYLLARLAEQQSECLRLHVPSEAYPVEAVPRAANVPVRDPLVDTLRHKDQWCG